MAYSVYQLHRRSAQTPPEQSPNAVDPEPEVEPHQVIANLNNPSSDPYNLLWRLRGTDPATPPTEVSSADASELRRARGLWLARRLHHQLLASQHRELLLEWDSHLQRLQSVDRLFRYLATELATRWNTLEHLRSPAFLMRRR